MNIYQLILICTGLLACTITKTEQNNPYTHSSMELLSNTNQTCPDDQQVLQLLQKAYNTINELSDEINTLNKATIAVSVVALIALYLYIPLMYTTYKQVSAAEKRINQFAPTSR